MTQQYSIDTLLAQAGNRSDERTGAVSTPIYLSTAYGTMGLVKAQGLIIPARKTQHVVFWKIP